MNFLNKNVCITGDFKDLFALGLNREEVEFFFAQLGAKITDVKKADFILAGERPGKDKISYAEKNNVTVYYFYEVVDLINADEDEIVSNQEILKELQKSIINYSPKYLGRRVLDDEVEGLIIEKLKEEDISKKWIFDFYESEFINYDKEKLISNYGSGKAKEYALEWTLKNGSPKKFSRYNSNNFEKLNSTTYDINSLCEESYRFSYPIIFLSYKDRKDKDIVFEILRKCEYSYFSYRQFNIPTILTEDENFMQTVRNHLKK